MTELPGNRCLWGRWVPEVGLWRIWHEPPDLSDLDAYVVHRNMRLAGCAATTTPVSPPDSKRANNPGTLALRGISLVDGLQKLSLRKAKSPTPGTRLAMSA